MKAVLDGARMLPRVGAASWDVFVRSGEVPPGRLEPFWTSPPYNHCNFTALPRSTPIAPTRLGRTSCAMAWANPDHRRILDSRASASGSMPDLEGYRELFDAVDEQGIAERW